MTGGGGGGTGGGGGGTGGGGGGGGGSGTGSGISGHITTDTTWADGSEITGAVTIDSGVTVTVSPGATVSIAQGVGITVLGTLNATGTSAGKIVFQPAAGASHFGAGEGGITVGDGTAAATLTYVYVTQTGGGLMVQKAATANITDTLLSQSPGDFLTTAIGSTVTVKYSQLGEATTPASDTTHCQTHFNGGTLTLVHSIIASATLPGGSYGTMFYGSDVAAKFMYDNWLAQATNSTNVDPTPGVTGDFSNGYFMGGAPPTMAGITANTLSTTPLVACDGTNNMTCAGLRP